MDFLVIIFAAVIFLAILSLFKSNVGLDFRIIPVAALAVVLVGSVFGHPFFHKGPITLDRLLFAGLCGFYILSVLKGDEQISRPREVDWAVILLTGFLIMNTLIHDYKYAGNMPISRLLFFNLLPVALYLLVRNAKLRLSDLKLISLCLIIFCMYLAATAFAETRGWTFAVFPRYISDEVALQEFFGRGRGPFLNPVSNGIFMIVGLASALMWWPHTEMKGKILLLFASGVIALGVFSTLTRSVWLAMILGIGLVIWMAANHERRQLLIIGGAIAVLLGGIFLSDNVQKFKRDKHVTEADMKQSASLRPLFAIIAWNMFKDRPMMGHGFGQYGQVKGPYMHDPHSGKPLTLTKNLYQHNVFLAYLTESGLIGLGLLVLLLVSLNRIGLHIFLNPIFDPWVRAFGLLLVVLLIAYSINGMFHDVSIIPQCHMLLFFLAGLVANLYYGYCDVRRKEVAAIVQLRRAEVERMRLESVVPSERELVAH